MGFPIHYLLIANAILAIVAGGIALLLIELATRHKLFNEVASGCIRKHRVAILVGMAAVQLLGGHVLVVPALLAAMIIVGIKFASMRCKSRRCRRGRATRNPDSNTIEPTDAERIAFAPHV